MKNENGVAMLVLIIIIAVIIVAASVIGKYTKEIVEETKGTDLTTNMLYIQAELKKDVENVCFKTANLDSNKEEDLTQINQIKQENLKGKLVKGSEIESNIPQEIEINENCYYLDDKVLSDMGLNNFTTERYGYFIVKYDFSNASVEVINTKGYNGKYTLTEMIEN